MNIGTITFVPALDEPELLAVPTREALEAMMPSDVYVAEIDPSLSDTAAFCAHYDIGMGISANCVVVEAKRGENVWYAACMILATDRIDINGAVRKYLDARKVSFAPMDTATALTAMEYGGITPIGLPEDWPILVDTGVAQTAQVIVGAGVRGAKLLAPGGLLSELPNAAALDIAKR